MMDRRDPAGSTGFIARMAARRPAAIGLCLAALCLCLSGGARACSVCGCGDPLQEAGDSRPSRGEIRLAFAGEYLARATARSAEDPQRTESLTQSTLRGSLLYSASDRLKVALMVPLVSKDSRAGGGEDLPEHSKNTGLGDVELGVRCFIRERTDFRSRSSRNLALSAGTSLPTGRNGAAVDGIRIDEHDQSGTGAWGPYTGLLYSIRSLRWSLSANLTGRLRTTNRYRYRYGDALLWGVEAQARPKPFLALGAGIEGRQAARDRLRGAGVANTGGTVWDLTPVLWVNPRGESAFYLRVQVPLARRLYGEQSVGTTTQAGFQVGWD